METQTTISAQKNSVNTLASNSGSAVVDYYTDAGPDYEFWSKNFNMHFGYAEKTWDCWSRETMLQRMNEVVLNTLNIVPGNKVVDFGCGLGATIRFAAKNHPLTRFTGFTITPWQIKKGNELLQKDNLPNGQIKYGNYNDIPLRKNSVDAVYGLESICHAEGTNKREPLREAYRILKEGGRFTMVDGFIKKPENELSSFTKRMYQTVCNNWALPSFPNINEVENTLKNIGFNEVHVEDISLKIAPSAVHSPFVTIAFLVKKIFKGEKLNRQSWKNLKACFCIFFLGLARQSIGYYKITATKS